MQGFVAFEPGDCGLRDLQSRFQIQRPAIDREGHIGQGVTIVWVVHAKDAFHDFQHFAPRALRLNEASSPNFFLTEYR